ncbi:MAG: hypothetical protein JSS50_03000 [Proteobacteria bacterium]|nr:hypothetical protein [Pseudomonadota bacterium]
MRDTLSWILDYFWPTNQNVDSAPNRQTLLNNLTKELYTAVKTLANFYVLKNLEEEGQDDALKMTSEERLALIRAQYAILAKYSDEARLTAMSQVFNKMRLDENVFSGFQLFYDELIGRDKSNPNNTTHAVKYTVEQAFRVFVGMAHDPSKSILRNALSNREARIGVPILYYWLSSTFCYRDKGVIRDFIDLDLDLPFYFENRKMLVLGSASEAFMNTITALYPNNCYDQFKLVSQLNAPYTAPFYPGYGAIFAVNGNELDEAQLINALSICNKHHVEPIIILLDKDSQAPSEEFSICMQKMTVARQISSMICEPISVEKSTGIGLQGTLRQLKQLTYTRNYTSSLASDNNYFGTPLPGHPILKHFARMERSCMTVGEETHFAKVVKGGVDLLCCCSSLPMEVFQELYLSRLATAQHPFYESNNAQYPFIIWLEGGREALMSMAKEWCQTLKVQDVVKAQRT